MPEAFVTQTCGGLQIDALVCDVLALAHIEPTGIDRVVARRRARILDNQYVATRLRLEFALEMRK